MLRNLNIHLNSKSMLIFNYGLCMPVKLNLFWHARLLPPGAFPMLFALPGMLLPSPCQANYYISFKSLPKVTSLGSLSWLFRPGQVSCSTHSGHYRCCVYSTYHHCHELLCCTIICLISVSLSTLTKGAPGQRLGLSCLPLNSQHLVQCLAWSKCSELEE